MAQKKSENGWPEKKELIIYKLTQLKEGYNKLNSTVSNLSGEIITLQHEIEDIKKEIQRRVTKRSTIVAAISASAITLAFNFIFEYLKNPN